MVSKLLIQSGCYMDELHELATQVAQRILRSDSGSAYDLGVKGERSRGEADLIALAKAVLREERSRCKRSLNTSEPGSLYTAESARPSR